MKKITILLALAISVYADISSIAQKMLKEEDRKMEKFEKEFNNPHNKYIRELEKKHYGKVVNGDKEQQVLHQDIVNSLSSDRKKFEKKSALLKKRLEDNKRKLLNKEIK